MTISNERIQELCKDGRLLSVINDYKKKRQAGKMFNIFVSAGIGNKENYVRNFMADLLRDDGSHGMGTCFLRLFVRNVLAIPKEDMEDAEIERAAIFTEDITYKSGTERRMDITINTEKRCIPIEIKIDARDQYRQCEDYFKEAKLRHEEKQGVKPVIYYLAKDENHKLSEDSKGECKEGIKCIYFKSDIAQWIHNCFCAATKEKNERVASVLEQFEENINLWFTSKPELKDIRETVTKLLKDSNEAVEFATYIANLSIQSKADQSCEVLSKIKECYDFYKNTILDDEFFGSIDQAVEKCGHILCTKTYKNQGSSYLCEKRRNYSGEYEVCLNIEPARQAGKLYIGYSLGQNGSYLSYKKSNLWNHGEETESLLGFKPDTKDIPVNGEWVVLRETEVDCRDMEKFVFNKAGLDDKINFCLNGLKDLLDQRYHDETYIENRKP